MEIAQKDAKITAADFYPSVDATYDYSQSGNTPEMRGSPYDRTGYTDWSVGASASWTFFESGKTFNAYREARENVAKIEAELANTVITSYSIHYTKLYEAACIPRSCGRP